MCRRTCKPTPRFTCSRRRNRPSTACALLSQARHCARRDTIPDRTSGNAVPTPPEIRPVQITSMVGAAPVTTFLLMSPYANDALTARELAEM